MLRFLTLAALLLAALAHAASVGSLFQARASASGIYHPPNGWENKQPGTVLQSSSIDAALFSFDKLKLKNAYQLLYRTSGSDASEPATTVTTVLVPNRAKKNQMVLLMPYIDASGKECSPSYSLRYGTKSSNAPAMSYQIILATALLDQGYTVTIPDYQGQNGAFSASRLEGHMALDAVRATLNYKPLGFSSHTKVVGYGYSGGAIASAWAAGLHSTYASELNVVGWAMGGTPVNVTATVAKIDNTLFAGFNMVGIAGMMSAYPELDKWAQEHLTPVGQKAVSYVRSHCMLDTLAHFPFESISSEKYFKNGTTLMQQPAVKKVADTLIVGTDPKLTPRAPVLMIHSQHDEVIPFGAALAAGRRWATHGADVFFARQTDFYMGHLDTELLNVPTVLFFVEDRMAGDPNFPRGFTDVAVSNPLADPRIAKQGLESLVRSIQDVLGHEIGPKDQRVKDRISARK